MASAELNDLICNAPCPVCDGPSGPRNGMKKGSSVTWWICGGCEVVRTVEMLRLLPCLIRSVCRACANNWALALLCGRAGSRVTLSEETIGMLSAPAKERNHGL